MAAPPGSTKKRVFMYGQWVEVTVLPPRPTPEGGVTAQPTNKDSVSAVDTTVYATPGQRRGTKRKRD